MIDLTGKTFGRLAVIGLHHIKTYRQYKIWYWLCRCDCGRTKVILARSLLYNRTRSCGSCQRSLDRTGKRYGRLVAIEPHSKLRNGYWSWLCQCDCGKRVVVAGDNLRRIRSCGCLRLERVSKRHTKKMQGKRCGRLTVLSPHHKQDGQWHWLCQCDCGKMVVANGSSLRRGHTQSCGCLRADALQDVYWGRIFQLLGDDITLKGESLC